jgi:hypothetical protein
MRFQEAPWSITSRTEEPNLHHNQEHQQNTDDIRAGAAYPERTNRGSQQKFYFQNRQTKTPDPAIQKQDEQGTPMTGP